jgi:hypothetical protein
VKYVAFALLVAACTSAADPGDADPGSNSGLPGDPGGKEDSPGPDWTSIGLGVAYKQVNVGNAILIAYGGYTAKLSYSAAWATELVDAKLGALDVGHIYAVQGPADAGYDGKEIANSKLRAHLATIDTGAPIYVVAHSSGSYVAHELLGQLHAAGSTDTLARLAYADLDGGGGGLTTEIVDGLRKITFVYAHDPTLSAGFSENHSAAEALAGAYAPHAELYEVTVPSTGCDNGAGWCMHDVVITHRPHHSWSYDLADDYTDFVARPPTIEYLDTLL